MSNRIWCIIDTQTKTAIYGHSDIVMLFSTADIAEEVARCLFKKDSDYVVFNTAKLSK